MTQLLQHFTKINLFSYDFAEKIKTEYKKVLKLPSLKLFSVTSDKKIRLDMFYFETLKVDERFPSLAKLLVLIFCLGHGQTSIERGFSHNNTTLQTNISEISVVSRRLIIDYMVSKNLLRHEIVISRSLMTHARASASRFTMFKAEQQKMNALKKQSWTGPA